MTISNPLDIMRLVDEYTSYLSARGVAFNEDGFPLVERTCYLDAWPEAVVPYSHRHSRLVSNPSETLLCLFCSDGLIYPRLEKVLVDIEEYKRYLGIVAADLTVTYDMDEMWQGQTMLVNQLFAAVLAANGVKIVANLRCGGVSSVLHLGAIPRRVMCASGVLGCDDIAPFDVAYVAKVLALRPSKLLLYGKRDPVMEERLAAMGVAFRRYPDFHACSLAEDATN